MRDLAGKVAVVTGGASGIGRGVALTLARAGMDVVVADIEEEPAKAVAAEVEACGRRALVVRTDVAERASVEALAEAAFGSFEAVHLLCNNAGVGAFGPLHEMTDEDWRWTLSVNLDGVVNGLQAFLPRMKAQPGEKHIVNTASLAGLIPFPGLGVYNASKYAVVAISETLRVEGAAYELGVSVLCPGGVRTNIINAERNRPAALGHTRSSGLQLDAATRERFEREGMDPLRVGEFVREGVLENRAYILTHPEIEDLFQARARAITSAFAEARDVAAKLS